MNQNIPTQARLRGLSGPPVHSKPKGVTKVAAARKLAVRLYWMMRQNAGYPEIAHIECSSRVALAGTTQADELIERSHPAVGWMFA